MKMRGPVYVLFAFQIFSLPVPLPKLFGKYQTRPEVKNPYPLDPACMKRRLRISVIYLGIMLSLKYSKSFPSLF